MPYGKCGILFFGKKAEEKYRGLLDRIHPLCYNTKAVRKESMRP